MMSLENDPVINNAIIDAANRFGFDPALIKAIIKQESMWKVDAVSRSGAFGLMQMMPATAMGEFGIPDVRVFASDPIYAINIGVEYLSRVRGYVGTSDLDWLLSGYNWGPTATRRNGPGYHRPETNNYIIKIRAFYEEYKRMG
jgi:soluble lytic murein transglycosylase-like protein